MNEDPVKIDLPARSESDAEEVTDFGPTLPVNLEQRRKRKDMSGMPDNDCPAKNDAAPGEKKESVQPPKSGAKRKFSVSDVEDEREARPVSIAPEDLRHTRRTTLDKSQPSKESTPFEKPVARIQREVALARAKTRDKAASNAQASAPSATSGPPRKALGPKTSNTDVTNSPKKPTKPPVGDDSSLPGKLGGAKGRERPRSRNEARIVIPAQVDPVVAISSTETIPEPETPAAPPEDLFSPTSSAPSTTRQISRDTPPPQEIGQDGEGHRPSRRARASVNYAEPNLRDKMRRPAEGSIDAVTGEGKYRRASCVPAEDEQPTAAKVKPEPGTGDDASWRSKLLTASSASVYSNSPLSGKVADAAPIQEISQRKRRSSQLYTNNGDEEAKSGSGTDISALMSASRKAKPELSDRDPVATAFKKMEKRMADLDIYEFSGSPPREVRSRAGRNNEDPQKQRMSRSQSATDMLDLTTAGRQSTRRRQSTLGVGMADAAAVKMEEFKSGEKASQRPTSLHAPKEGEGNERLGARRRSMML